MHDRQVHVYIVHDNDTTKSFVHVRVCVQVPVNERALGQIAISNYGNYNFQYRWMLSEQCTTHGAQGCQLVSIEKAEGTVEAHNRSSCELVFAPPKKMILKNCTMTLEVTFISLFVTCICIYMLCKLTFPILGFKWSKHPYITDWTWSGAQACFHSFRSRVWHVLLTQK